MDEEVPLEIFCERPPTILPKATFGKEIFMFSFNFVGKITPNLLAFFSSERLRDLSGGRGRRRQPAASPPG